MDYYNMKTQLKGLIAKGKTEKVIQLLLDITKRLEKTKLHNEVTVISNQYEEYAQNKRLGVSSYEVARQNKAQINLSLTAIIDQFNEEDLKQIAFEQAETKRFPKWKKRLIALFLLLFFSFSSWLILQQASKIDVHFNEEASSPKDVAKGSETGPAPPPDSANELKNVQMPPPASADLITSGKRKKEKTKEPAEPFANREAEITAFLSGRTVLVEGDFLKAFRIAEHEVSVGQYKVFCQETGRPFPKEVDTSNVNLPITYVSWLDAKAYCDYIKGRLPTVEEWFYAASGGKKSKGFIYSGGNTAEQAGWSSLQNGPKPVKSEGRKNELNLYDMSGNVQEWCADGPPGRPDEYYVKGGHWASYKYELELQTEAVPYDKHTKNSKFGFRIVLDY